MRLMKRFLSLLVLLCISVSGCTYMKPVTDIFRPAPWILELMPEGGDEVYNKAWQEGCETGLASMSNDYYKTFYKFRNTPSLVTNETYYKVWKDTFTFCRHYVYGHVRESLTRMRMPDAPWDGGVVEGVQNTVGFTGSLDSILGRRIHEESVISGPNSGVIFHQWHDKFFTPPSSANGGFLGNPGAGWFGDR